MCDNCEKDTTEKHSFMVATQAIAHGAMSIAKAAMGVDCVPLPVLQERRAICKACEFAAPGIVKKHQKVYCGPLWDSLMHPTGTCGCLILVKTMLASEACPKGKWMPHAACAAAALPRFGPQGSIGPSQP